MSKELTQLVKESLQAYNLEKGKTYDFGTNWYNVSNDFNDYVSNYLFPKLNETTLVIKPLGNRFEFLAKEIENIGQYSEEYVILDSIPINLDLNKERTLMLETNYPKVANKIYGAGLHKKVKFTVDDTFARRNFSTLKDAIDFALGVYAKRISDINVQEEQEIKAILLKYAKEHTKAKRTVVSHDVNGLIEQSYIAILNMQNNSSKYNECEQIIDIPYTTQSSLQDLLIITTDELKYKILDTKIAQTFNNEGLDITNHIISFDDFNDIIMVNKDTKVTQPMVDFLRNLGDYQIKVNETIQQGTIFSLRCSDMQKNNFVKLSENFKQLELAENFVYIFDVNKLKYTRDTKNMLTKHFNPEFKETNYWLHYYTKKTFSPFYNNILIEI
nr:MAG TPA: Major capsid protein [Caudoviricetes sp.]